MSQVKPKLSFPLQGWSETYARTPEEILLQHDERARWRRIHKALRSFLDRLPEPYRTIVHEHIFEDRSPAEIAERWGWSEEQVEQKLQRALDFVRERLGPFVEQVQ